MKGPLLCVLLASAVLLVGPAPKMNGVLMREAVEAPQWLMLPKTVEVSAIVYAGTPGEERSAGTIEAEVYGSADRALEDLKLRFEEAGFLVEGRGVSGSHNLRGTLSIIHPEKPYSAIITATSAGNNGKLHVSFREATPGSTEESGFMLLQATTITAE
jgi:hypothetical protein